MLSKPAEYVYIVQLKQHLGTNIFKIGKTKQDNFKRLNSYGKETKLILQIEVPNCDLIENLLIDEFKTHFIQKRNLACDGIDNPEHLQNGSREIFEGEISKMKKIMMDIILNPSNKLLKNKYIKKLFSKLLTFDEFKSWFYSRHDNLFTMKDEYNDYSFDQMNLLYQICINFICSVQYETIDFKNNVLISKINKYVSIIDYYKKSK